MHLEEIQMTTRFAAVLTLVLSSFIVWVPQAFAQSGGKGFYIGASGGITRADIDVDAVNQALIGAGATSASTTADQSGTGFKAYAGYSFTPNIAIEAGYFDLGKFTTESTVSPPGTASTELKFNGFNVDVVGSLPLGANFSVFGRLGVIQTTQDISISSTGSIVTLQPSLSYDKTSWKAGIGADYVITGGLGVRAEVEVYDVPDGPDNTASVGMFSIGLLYRF
jgi:OmpA-OmpF porin, OOP family